MKATATIYTTTGTEQKGFTVEARENGKLFCPDLVEWAINHPDRVSGYINITVNGRTATYTI